VDVEIALVLVSIVALAAVGALIVRRQSVGQAEPVVDEQPPEPLRLADDEVSRIVTQLRAELAETQSQALQSNAEQFLTLAEQRLRQETSLGEEQLKARQAEFDRGLRDIHVSLNEMTKFVQETDKRRQDSLVELGAVVRESQTSVQELNRVTQGLNQALTSGQRRGQWGERMADDILRVSGLIEGVNYTRNTTTSGSDGAAARPDFTFLLPQNRILHMDVKFPLAGYLRYLEAATDPERDAARKQFLSDVRARLREVVTRGYIDPAAGTLDYVLVFIPNEQVYSFIHEHDPNVLDEALGMRVVLCSPITLFAVLAVIRQSVENFHLSEQTDRILSALGGFATQWEKYQEAIAKLGGRLDSARKAYDELATTRTNVLQRQVDKVETLRVESGVEADTTIGQGEVREQPEIPEHLLNER
jgi:DNA recombination protein RmuC